jgi:Rod binding domain-containing protein
MHFMCASEFSKLYHTFLDEALSQNMAHIDDLIFYETHKLH